ncbi:MAG: maltose alpha-D-glucosyltransferase [Thermodesulfobacteriota bacterium]
MEKRQTDTVDPVWYKDAVIYELHVKAFCDSNGDGIGDFKGLKGKLDYLQDLGVTAVWLLPFFPSPLRDDGYDISDYAGIHPAYGTLRDFREFLKEAHRRGIRVITEMVLNHTSDQHRWFQRARRSKPGSRWRNFYVWSDTPDRYNETRVIFQDFQSSNWSWDSAAEAYYWHRFYYHQPDLNYDNQEVQKAIFKAIDFWLGMGVDGLRLDAVPYLFEREGTNCENLPENHEFIKDLRSHIDRRYPNRLLLAEANQWPEDAAAYFGEGDECHMAFNFPLMPRLYIALRMEDRFPIIDILEQTPSIPETCQWALFLRNHDELTLEMVTDEERDYMYRVFAEDPQMRLNLGIRRRLAPLLGNHRRRIELMNGLLFSMPGTPIIYQGDEIGMGDNIYLGDRDGVRTPMQWSGDRNAGFSKANPQKLYLPVILDPEYHYEAVNVEVQQNNLHSPLWWMKRRIAVRKHYKAFGRGTLEFLYPENRKILAFIRTYGEERILVVANLSRFAQCAELDLSSFQGMVPLEIFGQTRFPPIGELPYFLTLGPRDFYWFSLVPHAVDQGFLTEEKPQLPTLEVSGTLEQLFRGRAKAALESVLPQYVKEKRWFGGKAQSIKSANIAEVFPVGNESAAAYITLVQVDYTHEDTETYVLPLAYGSAEKAEQMMSDYPGKPIAHVRLKDKKEEGIIYDATADKVFAETLLEMIVRRRRPKGKVGRLIAGSKRPFRKIRGSSDNSLEPSILKVEQSNTSIVYGDRFILKLFRQLHPGVNPDLEIGLFLTEQGFGNTPPIAGSIEYRRGKEEPTTLAILQALIPNQGDAWEYTLDVLGNFFEQILAQREEAPKEIQPGSSLELIDQDPGDEVLEAIGPYVESARLLGQRTAELHLALASRTNRDEFTPEPFSTLYQRALYQSMRILTIRVFGLLQQHQKDLPEAIRPRAKMVLESKEEIFGCFRSITRRKIRAMRIRCHGDYHLGQVLYTGKDFVIIDFEGEPARPISERKIKRSPLRDVAGMLRSFHYAAYVALQRLEQGGLIRGEELAFLEPWAQFWHLWVGAFFLNSYLENALDGRLLPRNKEELEVLLDIYLLEKAVYEMGYELNNRPQWVKIPLQGIEQVLHLSSS